MVLREPNRVVVEVDRTAPGYLVLLDVWYPGWECRTADGGELPVWRADGLFRAVAVPAGKQRLTFVFHPLSFRVGRAVSLFTLGVVIVLAAGVIVRRWRRRPAAPASGSEPVVMSFVIAVDLPDVGRRAGREKPVLPTDA